jgi:predicted transcriptional regulator
MNTQTPKRDPRATSIRLSDTADELWAKLARHLGISKQAVIEMALRKLARNEDIPVPGDEAISSKS